MAMLVAFLLVVQTLFSGFATGAQASSRSFDVICATDGSLRTALADPAADRTHRIDCCTLGCPMLGGALTPPALPGLHHHAPAIVAASLRNGDILPIVRAELAPLQTRAPPTT